MPIASLPILNGKMYMVFDLALVHAAHRNKNLSFIPYALEFAQRIVGYDDSFDRIIRVDGFIDEFFEAIHTAFSNRNNHQMNTNFLRSIASRLVGLCASKGEEFIVPNVYLWIRDLMTYVTCDALFGPGHPFTENRPSLKDDLWYVMLFLAYLALVKTMLTEAKSL